MRQSGVYRFRVEGVDTKRASSARPFDETFEVEAEHPAEALAKLVSEIEWAILDSDEPFTISYLGQDADD